MDSKQLSEFVGKRIRYYRRKAKMTQRELGEKLGVKNNTVSDYEYGKISPEQNILFAISRVFDIRVDDLFPKRKNVTDELERALKMTDEMSLKDVELLNTLIEKTLSMDEQEREKFVESLRFTVEYHDKLRKD